MLSSAEPLTATAETRRGWRFYLSAWFPVFFMVGCIALESQAFFGADHTAEPLRKLVQWLIGPVPNAQWDRAHFYIRKCGHFSGYGLLSLTWFRGFWMIRRTGGEVTGMGRRLATHLLAIFGTLLVASADEFHQSFLPNRTGTPVDVLIDCTGALAVQLLIFLGMLWFFRASTEKKFRLSH